jgi:hypothetical protein
MLQNVNLNQEQKCFLGWQLQVAVNCQDGQQKHTVHKPLTLSNRCLFSPKKGFKIESYYIRLFSFSAAPAKYLFRPNI